MMTHSKEVNLALVLDLLSERFIINKREAVPLIDQSDTWINF